MSTHDDGYYQQIDGLSMGNPISATLANISLVFHENKWLNECPMDCKPIYYRRYVDDTFLIFDDESKIDKFFQYINNQHTKIRFTIEKERNHQIPFLDVLVTKENNHLSTEVYRKPTYTGLGTHFLSCCSTKFKINSFSTFFYRAFHISKTYIQLHQELEKLKTFFLSNGFPINLFFKEVRKFFNLKYSEKPRQFGPAKLDMYFKFPFLNNKSNAILTDEIKKLLSKYFPQIKGNIIFYNNHKIKTYVNHKDSVPTTLKSMIVYLFKCPTCSNSYVGSTRKCLFIRSSEHRGVSPRTGNILARPTQSSIRNHCHEVCKVNVNIDDFSVIFSGNENEIRIAESLMIKEMNPELNLESSSFNLRL